MSKGDYVTNLQLVTLVGPIGETMKLWVLRLNRELKLRESAYDRYYGFIVRAENEKVAREMATEEAKFNPTPNDWKSTDFSCEELTAEGEAEIVSSDFNRG